MSNSSSKLGYEASGVRAREGDGEVYARPVELMDYDFNLSKLERVMSGADKVAALGHELERRGLKRTIVVTGKTLGGSALLEKVTGATGARCVAVFKGARQHVPRSSVHELQALIERSIRTTEQKEGALRSFGRSGGRDRAANRLGPRGSQ